MNLANYSINIPALTINYYGLLLISSFFIHIAILLVLTIKEKYKNYEIASLVALECISWLIALLFFRSSFYALLLIVLSGFIIFLITKMDPKKLFAILLFSVPLIYAIGKLGCFLNGCCYGIDYSGPLRVLYSSSKHAPTGISLFPVQLVESIVNLIIFIISITIYYKKKDITKTLPFIVLACSTVKFLLDFLRTPGKHIISLNQIFCIIAFIIGIIIIIKSKKAPTS